MKRKEHIETVVIGGGQSGLAVGWELQRRGLPFVILDAAERTGDVWRKRWDSLKLFTPARMDSLPGMRFPASGTSYPTKDEFADYLESYAKRFQLPIRHATRALRLTRKGDGFVVETPESTIQADHVIVAMSKYQKPKIPGMASDLDDDIVQMHSLSYRNPSQLAGGTVLIVGSGNSAADIGMELTRTHRVVMAAGSDNGELPFHIDKPFGRTVGFSIVRFVFHHVINLGTPVGRKVRPHVLGTGPLVRVKRREMDAAGIERAARLTGMRDGRPVLEDGRVLDVDNVIWCTGFKSGFSSWIDIPDLGDLEHDPTQVRGVVPNHPGLYFVGLHFLFGLSSGMIHGMPRDARYVVRKLASLRASRRREHPAREGRLEAQQA